MIRSGHKEDAEKEITSSKKRDYNRTALICPLWAAGRVMAAHLALAPSRRICISPAEGHSVDSLMSPVNDETKLLFNLREHETHDRVVVGELDKERNEQAPT